MARAWQRRSAPWTAWALLAAALPGRVAAADTVAASAPAPAAAACGQHLPKPARQLIRQDGLQLAFAPRPAPVPLGRHFALDIEVCSAAGATPPALRSVDAEMPAHRHGMNYRPSVQALGPGRWQADGLMLHMPGTWRLWFELDPGPGLPPVRLSQDLQLR